MKSLCSYSLCATTMLCLFSEEVICMSETCLQTHARSESEQNANSRSDVAGQDFQVFLGLKCPDREAGPQPVFRGPCKRGRAGETRGPCLCGYDMQTWHPTTTTISTKWLYLFQSNSIIVYIVLPFFSFVPFFLLLKFEHSSYSKNSCKYHFFYWLALVIKILQKMP